MLGIFKEEPELRVHAAGPAPLSLSQRVFSSLPPFPFFSFSQFKSSPLFFLLPASSFPAPLHPTPPTPPSSSLNLSCKGITDHAPRQRLPRLEGTAPASDGAAVRGRAGPGPGPTPHAGPGPAHPGFEKLKEALSPSQKDTRSSVSRGLAAAECHATTPHVTPHAERAEKGERVRGKGS